VRSQEPEVGLRNQGPVPACHSERCEESCSDKAGMANYGSVSRKYKAMFLAPPGMTAHLATKHWALATAYLIATISRRADRVRKVLRLPPGTKCSISRLVRTG